MKTFDELSDEEKLLVKEAQANGTLEFFRDWNWQWTKVDLNDSIYGFRIYRYSQTLNIIKVFPPGYKWFAAERNIYAGGYFFKDKPVNEQQCWVGDYDRIMKAIPGVHYEQGTIDWDKSLISLEDYQV
jgi:hypothetical protein